ncbi:hypothetical protein SAMN04487914_10890 [Arthrobacter sp. ok909]|uniref:hypothetical protein n=1 Tax=Arthrobacter sp. ok909 TaxID=1761746 RepID=UPI000880B10F|nr:hypothetical protein [Arthrobacter sp. ok909]SDP33250.1 hypothetical protein SAMN04487914_10890 [Arthrobacter sp. ok909]
MTSVPMPFFQVGATAIPTLLVAVAIGIKAGNLHGEVFQSARKSHKIAALFSSFFFIAIVTAGELSALTALFKGYGNSIQAACIWTAMTTCLFLIIIEFVGPISNSMTAKGGWTLATVLLLSWVGVNLYGNYIMSQN